MAQGLSAEAQTQLNAMLQQQQEHTNTMIQQQQEQTNAMLQQSQERFNVMVQQSIQNAVHGLGPNFERLQQQIEVLNSGVGNGGGSSQSEEARRQDILNRTIAESQTSLRNTLRERYAEAGLNVTDNDLNASVGKNTTRDFSQKDNTQKMRVDDLPKFDGRGVHGYLINVTSAIVQFGQQAVARTIPRTFEGQARNWWNVLSDDTKTSYMSNVHRFKDALEDEFADSIGVAKDKAKNRTWRIGSEDIMTYYYDKIDLMVNSNHGNYSEVEVCYELREGLPIEFRPYIRTVLEKNPSTQRMRKEFQSLESDFLKMSRSSNSRKFTPPMSPPSSMSPSRSASYSPGSEGSGPVYRRGRSEPPLRESYDPKKVGQQAGPDGRMLRSYTLPSGQVILLNRTCRVNGCNGNHFDFEHDHLNVKKRAQSIAAAYDQTDSTMETYEGYPIASSYPLVEEESDEDESQGMKLLSYRMADDNMNNEDHSFSGETRYFSRRRGTKN